MPPSGFHAGMIAKGTYEKYAGGVNKSTVLGAGAFTSGGLLGKNDGSGTDRSTHNYVHHYNPLQSVKEDKSFTSPSSAVGAVSALNLAGVGLSTNLDSSIIMKNNLLSTPSSGKSKSGISQADSDDLQKQ